MLLLALLALPSTTALALLALLTLLAATTAALLLPALITLARLLLLIRVFLLFFVLLLALTFEFLLTFTLALLLALLALLLALLTLLPLPSALLTLLAALTALLALFTLALALVSLLTLLAALIALTLACLLLLIRIFLFLILLPGLAGAFLEAGLLSGAQLVLFPFGKLLLRFFLADSILFLQLADQLVLAAGNHVEFIIGEFSPTLFDCALKLFPVTFNTIPIHLDFLAVKFEYLNLPGYGSRTHPSSGMASGIKSLEHGKRKVFLLLP